MDSYAAETHQLQEALAEKSNEVDHTTSYSCTIWQFYTGVHPEFCQGVIANKGTTALV